MALFDNMFYGGDIDKFAQKGGLGLQPDDDASMAGMYAQKDDRAMRGLYGMSRNAINSIYGQAGQLDKMGSDAWNPGLSGFKGALGRAEANSVINPEDRMGEAVLDVGMAHDKARGIAERQMQRMGVNPNSGRFAGLEQKWGLARAAAEAGAKTKARKDVQDVNFSRLLNLANQYSGLMGQGLRAKALAQSGYGMAADRYGALGDRRGRLADEEGEREYIDPPEQDGQAENGQPQNAQGQQGQNQQGQSQQGQSQQGQKAIKNPLTEAESNQFADDVRAGYEELPAQTEAQTEAQPEQATSPKQTALKTKAPVTAQKTGKVFGYDEATWNDFSPAQQESLKNESRQSNNPAEQYAQNYIGTKGKRATAVGTEANLDSRMNPDGKTSTIAGEEYLNANRRNVRQHNEDMRRQEAFKMDKRNPLTGEKPERNYDSNPALFNIVKDKSGNLYIGNEKLPNGTTFAQAKEMRQQRIKDAQNQERQEYLDRETEFRTELMKPGSQFNTELQGFFS